MRVLRNFLPRRWRQRPEVTWAHLRSGCVCSPAASALELIVFLSRNCSRSWYIVYNQYLVTNVYTRNFLQERPSWEAVSRSACQVILRSWWEQNLSLDACVCRVEKRWGMSHSWQILRYDSLKLGHQATRRGLNRKPYRWKSKSFALFQLYLLVRTHVWFSQRCCCGFTYSMMLRFVTGGVVLDVSKYYWGTSRQGHNIASQNTWIFKNMPV